MGTSNLTLRLNDLHHQFSEITMLLQGNVVISFADSRHYSGSSSSNKTMEYVSDTGTSIMPSDHVIHPTNQNQRQTSQVVQNLAEVREALTELERDNSILFIDDLSLDDMMLNLLHLDDVTQFVSTTTIFDRMDTSENDDDYPNVSNPTDDDPFDVDFTFDPEFTPIDLIVPRM